MVIDFIRNKDNITHVVVEFENKEAGKALRQQQPDTFNCLYENGTPIPTMKFTYSISKKTISGRPKGYLYTISLAIRLCYDNA